MSYIIMWKMNIESLRDKLFQVVNLKLPWNKLIEVNWVI